MTMPVSDEVVDRLVHHGIDVVFGVPGTQTLPVNEAIDGREDIRYVMARHETAVAHQAWGYAETTGRPAATAVVPGPGDMNAMNGLKNALNDCTPLVHVAIETDPEVRGGDDIHETPPDTYDNAVKENILVENPEGTVVALDRAVAIATTPPKGPVRLGIPKRFLGESPSMGAVGSISREFVTGVPEDAVVEACDLLGRASAPVIVAGGGVRSSGAERALRRTAERLGAPVVTTYKGKGVIPEDHPLSAGVLCGASSPELLECLEGSDVVLGVGTDFDAVATSRWSVPLPETLVHVTLDEADLGTGYRPAVGIVADATAALDAIVDALPSDHRPADGEERARAIREADDERIGSLRSQTAAPLTSVSALAALREALPRETIVTADAGGYRLWMVVAFEAYGSRRYVNPGSWASMGTGFPAAIGAQVANPDTPVVSIIGDGGLLMCLHELHTVVSEDIPVVIVVFRNDDYAVISDEAERGFDLDAGEYDWVEHPIDFVAVARGMGVEARSVADANALRGAVTDAIRTNGPVLIEVPTDPREPQASELMTE